MSLLVLEAVSKSYRRGSREKVALCDVSLSVNAGEMVSIYGRRQSGRSTLLRVAAGIERPDSGLVRLEGRDLAERSSVGFAARIGYCQKALGSPEGETVLESWSAESRRRPLGRGRGSCWSVLTARTWSMHSLRT
jgi:ABC-type multidrug transport system ATPase subunit